MDSVTRPFPISLDPETAAHKSRISALRLTVVAVGFTLMIRAALFLRSCNY
jgi:hypothetical protein